MTAVPRLTWSIASSAWVGSAVGAVLAPVGLWWWLAWLIVGLALGLWFARRWVTWA